MKIEDTTNYTKVIFGFADLETGNKLREFCKKHTGIDIDFNNIKHYKNGFKLLAFDLPLGKFTTIGVTAAAYSPHDVKRISGSINDFIYWYEHDYLGSNKTRELISQPRYFSVPLNHLNEFFRGELRRFRNEHTDFDVFLKELGNFLKEDNEKYFDNLIRFINNKPKPNWMSPEDCMFTALVKLYNLNLSSKDAYDYIKECLLLFKKMRNTRYQLSNDYKVFTKKSRWDSKERKWINISITPKKLEDFSFSLSLESLQIEDNFNDMKVHHDVELTLLSPNEKYLDALMLFEFYQNRGLYRRLHRFAISELTNKRIIKEVETGESVGLITHLYKIVDK